MNVNRIALAVAAAMFLGQCPLLCDASLPCVPPLYQIQFKNADSPPPSRGLQPASPKIPTVRLATMEGFDDDAAYVQSMADRAADLAEQAEQSTDPSTRASLLMAAANVTLAHELEPICSAELLHLPDSPDDREEARVSAALDRADDWIGRAKKIIEGIDHDPEKEKTSRRELQRRREILDAFAQAFRAYLIPGDAREAAGADRRATSRLSVLLEDDDPQVVTAATLWQACLRARQPNLDRALAMLDRALADPPGRSLPYAFFERLLRCRLLARRGGHATALALLAQIEDLSTEWMGNDADRADALRTLALLNTQILADWHDRMSQADQSAERAWCSRRIEAIRAEHFGDENNTVLRLSPAVPLVAPAPEGFGQPAEPALPTP